MCLVEHPHLPRRVPELRRNRHNVEDGERQGVAWVGWTGDDDPRLVKQRSDAETFLRFLGALVARGEGYAEVARDGQTFPALTLSVAAGRGVVHQFPSEEGCFLLRGDGAVPPGEVVEMPILEGLGRFSGDFVLTARHAVGAVEAFARGEAIAQLGEWVEL